MAKVTIKNTKQEILDALKESEEKCAELKKNVFDPMTAAKQEADKKAVESVEESVKSNIFSEEMTKKFEDLQKAIDIKSKELSDLYGVEKTLQDITVAANAKVELIAKLDVQYSDKEKALIERYSNEASLIEELDKKKDRLTTEIEELRKSANDTEQEIMIRRGREQEEYDYILKRNRAKENDEWNDYVAKREAELAAKEKEIAEKLADADAKQAVNAELQAKVDDIPRLIEEAKQAGRTEAEKDLGREYGYKKSMADKEHEFAIKIMEDKISSLESALAKANDEAYDAKNSLSNAYDQIREIATKTVESTGGVKVISSGSDNGRK